MTVSNNTAESLLKLLFDSGSAPPMYMSLHTDHPGDELANEVDYPGYERQLFAGGMYTSFPQVTSGMQVIVTHAALSASVIGGTAIVIAEVNPGISLRTGVTPQIMLTYNVPSLLSSMPPPSPPPPPPVTMGSRFAALAAELEEDDSCAPRPEDEDED